MAGTTTRNEREDDPKQPEILMIGAGAPEQADDSWPAQFSLPSLAEAVWKQKKSIALIWLIITLAAFFGVRLMPAVYEAEALVLLEPQSIPHDFVSPTTVRADLWERLSSLEQRVLSHTQLMSLIENFGLYREEARTLSPEALVERVRQDIRVTLEPGLDPSNRPPAFRVSYSGPDPEQVAQVANRLAYLFIEQDLRERSVEAVGTADFLESQLEAARRQLEAQERRLSQYKTAHNGELPEQEGALLGTLARLQTQLQANQDAVRQAQQDKFFTRNALEEAISSADDLRALTQGPDSRLGAAGPTLPAALEDPTTRALRELKNDLIGLRQRYTANHPEVLKAEEALRELEAAVREQEAQVALETAPEGGEESVAPQATKARSPALASLLEPEVRRRQDQISQLQTQLKSLDNRIETLESSQGRLMSAIADAERQIQKLPIREQEIAALARDYEITKVNYQSLLRKKMDADLAMEMEKRQKTEKFVLLEAARTPSEPIKPKVPVLTLAGSGFGFLLGAIFGLGRELRRNVLLGEWELPDNLEIMGRVPSFAVGTGQKTTLSFHRVVIASCLVLLLAVLGIGAVGLHGAWPPL